MTGLVLGLATTGALLAAGLAGCGGGSKPASGATPGGAPSGGQQQLQAYISCLNQHGVHITLPSGRPSGFPSGFNRSGRPTARPTVRPSGARSGFPRGGNGAGGGFGGGFGGIFGNGGQPPTGVSQATWEAAQQACASVEPSFGAGGRGGFRGGDNGANAAYLNCLREHGAVPSSGPVGRLNTADPAIAAAVKTCEPLRPTGQPNPGSSTG
ncbi:hypothetical protein Raf01_64190 [Rugosimonospora africana]|uniref:PT repeat-containing protein n=2 Tax=Rugosimonospora africana TaxID=556532 RepID=A0A8J3QY32_9ACTN|nr:hypothetical protein Raf01_64190 [Rugosimonospora africana]